MCYLEYQNYHLFLKDVGVCMCAGLKNFLVDDLASFTVNLLQFASLLKFDKKYFYNNVFNGTIINFLAIFCTKSFTMIGRYQMVTYRTFG